MQPSPAMQLVTDAGRWQPTRAGLIGLWRYADETFTFHNGRLLLRGPNGSGKSMALELLLPFLLDGDSSPARLTSASRARGRLFDRLMTGSPDATRTGYAWVEFGRGREVFTVGARVRGSRATDKTDVDLFTTSLAVGRELHLLDGTRTPLARKALIEALGDRGRVHGSIDEHRAAVREALFPGFSAERYSSVIGALLALRKEKLSEKLDPEKLSDVLSEALPPLDEHDIASVAEGFERLDRRRAGLAELERDLDQVRALARGQRAYALAVVVGAGATVRSAETSRDDVTRHHRRAQAELAEASARRDAAASERDGLQDRLEQIRVELEALKDSEAYRAGAGIADLRREAGHRRAGAERDAERAARDAAERDRAQREADHAEGEHATTEANAQRADDDLRVLADRAGAESAVAEAASEPAIDDGERLLTAWVRARRQRLAQVRAALAAHQHAVTQRDVHDEQVSRSERVATDRAAQRDEAERAEAASRARYAAAVTDWVQQCPTVGIQRLQEVLPKPADDPHVVAGIVGDLRHELAATDAADRQRLADQRERAEAELAAARAERARWQSSALVPPDPPDWRSPRSDRVGAPLWQLVDLAADCDAAAVDRLEAALTAAGLIDAWVTPDGRVDLAPDQADVQLAADAAAENSLRALLVPAAATGAVPADTVSAVLSSIPIADTALPAGADQPAAGPRSSVLLGRDGTFRLGTAVGRGPDRPAMLLGAAARERHRLARLAQIDATIADIERGLAALARQLTDLDRRRDAVGAELAARPAGDDVEASAAAAAYARARLSQAEEALEASRVERRRAEDTVRAALRDLTTLATQHGLPSDQEALADVEATLSQFTDAVASWARRRRDVLAAARALDAAIERAQRAAAAATRAKVAAAATDREATELEQRVHTLESAVGADYQQTLTAIGGLERERDNGNARIRGLTVEVGDLQTKVGALGEEARAADTRRQEVESAREHAQRRFVAALHALAADAGISIDTSLDTATAVLAAARTIGAEHERVDSSARAVEQRSGSVANQVHQAKAALGARVDVDRVFSDDGWWTLRTSAGGIRRHVGEQVEVLATQLADSRAELEADEERLFEQTLAGSVRRALAERIRQARALVDGINVQLGAIKTAAAGVGVQLRWDVDREQPSAVHSARGLLLRDPADLNDQQRVSLQEFVRARVEQARVDLEANAPWEARLRESLDYRAWHRFSLQIAHRDWDGYQPATGPRLQRLSTGERSIALHLPMIASVAAHYADESGEPAGCPRLILLDELFAGVDTANRAQLFGAFSTWQLDAVFTSDHEWCQYADLDGIAIHYLHPPTGDEPVTSTRFTWDGRRRQIDPAVA